MNLRRFRQLSLPVVLSIYVLSLWVCIVGAYPQPKIPTVLLLLCCYLFSDRPRWAFPGVGRCFSCSIYYDHMFAHTLQPVVTDLERLLPFLCPSFTPPFRQRNPKCLVSDQLSEVHWHICTQHDGYRISRSKGSPVRSPGWLPQLWSYHHFSPQRSLHRFVSLESWLNFT